ncbi:hydroxyphenylacetyl-CoA thioesterase PaaI [Anaerobacillus sp. MEB173]|uniref:hydroxyphenylacetyl-CoA thioesterase PaaI n=1 Tax=Anaerobacillus sp. MEB173 TaxID=3383345 RepID=UPI003F92229B
MKQELLSKLSSDPYAKHLGITIDDVGEGYAKLSMVIEEHMLNFHGSANGGVIFSLADAAFAVASNSHGKTAVGITVTIHYMAPSWTGERIFAIAKEDTKSNRLGLYRMDVVNEDNVLIAVAEGMVYRKNNPVID